MTSQLIRRFQITGQVVGDKIVQARDTLKNTMLGMMKDDGYTPLYDLDPVWNQEWVKEDIFAFTYTWQGVHVGKDKAWQTEGISGGRMIPSSPKK